MATRSVQEQINLLLERKVAEDKTGGAPSSDIEGTSVMESIVMSLLLQPRTILYVAMMARDGLLAAAKTELSSIESLRQTISDLGNKTTAITDLRSLEKAKTSVLQVEAIGNADRDSVSFSRYDSAVSGFLKKLSKNVRQKGRASLVRPAAEAAEDLPSDFAALNESHTDFLDRLYALSVGVDNFLTAPFRAVIGTSTTSRVRRDIEDMIEEFSSNPSGSNSRDAAIRLIAGRAALRVLGAGPSITDPVIDSASSLPVGFQVQARSEEAPASVVSSSLDLSGAMGITVNVNGVSQTSSILIPSRDLSGRAFIVSSHIEPTVSVPAHTYLFVTVTPPSTTWTIASDGTYSSPLYGSGFSASQSGAKTKTVRVLLNPSSTSVTLTRASIQSLIKTAIDNGGSLATSSVDLFPGGDRLVISGDFDELSIASYCTEYDPSSTIAASKVYMESAHELLGFGVGQSGKRNQFPADLVADSLSATFGSLIQASVTSEGNVSITTVSVTRGTFLELSGPAAVVMGVSGRVAATSSQAVLFGTVRGVATDPIGPVDLLDIGDYLSCTSGSSTIDVVSDSYVTLSQPIPTFSGNITVISSLTKAWSTLSASIASATDTWLGTDFSKDLLTLDRAIAPVVGSPTLANRNAALAVLDDLRSRIESVVTLLNNSESYPHPAGATKERALARGIVETLEERKYDRARDMFLRCQVREMMSLDWQSMSYAGSVMGLASDIAQSDIYYPNRTKDEGNKPLIRIKRSDLP